MQGKLLSCAFPFPENNFGRLDERGKFVGEVAKTLEEALDLGITSSLDFDLRFKRPKKDNLSEHEFIIEGLNMLSRGEVDTAFGSFGMLEGLPPNITCLPLLFNSWCKLGSSPSLKSQTLDNGPENAVLQMNLAIVIAMIISLLLVIYLPSLFLKSNVKGFLWHFYQIFVKQKSLPDYPYKPFAVDTISIIMCVFIIQVLFASYMNTERTSMNSFIKIDTIDDVEKYNVTFISASFSACPKLVNPRIPLLSLNPDFERLHEHNLEQYLRHGKSAILASQLEFNLLRVLMCFDAPEEGSDSPLYWSPVLKQFGVTYFYNKNIYPEVMGKFNLRAHYLLNMGLAKQRGPFSEYFARKLAIRQPDIKCMATNIITSTSFASAAAVSNRYFRRVYGLFIIIAIIAIFLFVNSIFSLRRKLKSSSKNQETFGKYK